MDGLIHSMMPRWSRAAGPTAPAVKWPTCTYLAWDGDQDAWGLLQDADWGLLTRLRGQSQARPADAACCTRTASARAI